MTPRTVLITGCSDGGLGASLALAFHAVGLKVYATARNSSKLGQVSAAGIETLVLDVLSSESIKNAVMKIPNLDILVNNAGAEYLMPVTDVDIAEAKRLFDLNVWSYIEVTQAFLPLLLKSPHGALIVNQSSAASVTVLPFQGVYTASKAAIAMLSDTLRLELSVMGITVVDLKTGMVCSNLIKNQVEAKPAILPATSIYYPAREIVEKTMNQDGPAEYGMPNMQWATAVVGDLLKKKPPPLIWRGEQAWLARLICLLPLGIFDGMLKKMGGLDIVEKIMKLGA
ncbi:Short-chain dehydrogenase/reductase SDR [Penicillium taxi]|uniref:Short-chain dehydrogenase/reductase SDR n=1 Tax=Penicillium taxi TaxID=168475 RepID=UPI002544E08B|nr:Short-chain dehydrogenase/reductase SDR [Penicillium taxi]KAJ5884890.1 Short-chain dehydrogenase/reductase SDR [Penicillium taxi]